MNGFTLSSESPLTETLIFLTSTSIVGEEDSSVYFTTPSVIANFETESSTGRSTFEGADGFSSFFTSLPEALAISMISAKFVFAFLSFSIKIYGFTSSILVSTTCLLKSAQKSYFAIADSAEIKGPFVKPSALPM